MLGSRGETGCSQIKTPRIPAEVSQQDFGAELSSFYWTPLHKHVRNHKWTFQRPSVHFDRFERNHFKSLRRAFGVALRNARQIKPSTFDGAQRIILSRLHLTRAVWPCINDGTRRTDSQTNRPKCEKWMKQPVHNAHVTGNRATTTSIRQQQQQRTASSTIACYNSTKSIAWIIWGNEYCVCAVLLNTQAQTFDSVNNKQ